MFSAADAYERFMGRWSRRLAASFVGFAGVQDGDAVLDVGCGTGSLSAALAVAAPAGTIVGIDRAAPYVADAQQRIGGERVRFAVGDAQQLPYDDGAFDRTVSLLILNFIPEPRTAVAEMTRVTRPGGTVAAAVWDYGQGMEMLRIFWDEAIAVDPDAGAKDERHMPFCRGGALEALWREQGLQNVAGEALTIATSFRSFADYWAPFLENQGPAGAYVAALSANTREHLRIRLRRRLLGDEPDRAIELSARAWAVRGTA